MDSAINPLSIKHPHQIITFIAWLCALAVMLIGLLAPENKSVLMLLSLSSLCLLMFNSVTMSAWVFKRFKDQQLRFIAAGPGGKEIYILNPDDGSEPGMRVM